MTARTEERPSSIVIDAETLDPDAAYRLISGSVVPRPIAWVTSVSDAGVVNLAPFSCFTFLCHEPPMVAISIGRKARLRKDTSSNIRVRREFVVNIGDMPHVQALHLSSAEMEPERSEAAELGLVTIPCPGIRTPRLADVPISMECELEQMIEVGAAGTELFIGKVRKFHIRDGLLRDGKIDTRHLNPICRIGGPNYAALGNIVTLQDVPQTF